jgi:hypothetical protein
MHFIMSMIKSCFRVIAGCYLAGGDYVTAGGCFIVAEVVGILEEMV